MSTAEATPAAAVPAVPGATETVAAVESLLTQHLDALAREWRAGAETQDAILGEHDVPDLLATLVLAGGKRLRPLLCHWGWAAVPGADPASHAHVVRTGAALELLHAFALAQDDVMDRSPTRRGRPAVHVEAAGRHRGAAGRDDADHYGESIATLVGDLGHAEADALVCDLPARVRRHWRLTSIELVRGQARDLADAAGGAREHALERALEVARAKSGAYTVQRPLELGALLAGGGPGCLAALGEAGRLLGEAFALRDDLLGVWGRPETTGKPAGDDLRLGKSTVLLALAEQRLSGPAAEAVARVRCQEHDEDDVVLVADAMVAQGVRDEVEQMVSARVLGADAALDDPEVTPHAREGLARLARRIAWREL